MPDKLKQLEVPVKSVRLQQPAPSIGTFFFALRRLLSSSASAGHGPAILLVTHPEEPSPTSVFRPRLRKVPGIKATVGKH